MVTHDFSAPIPAGTLRISVICNDHLHRTDLLMVKVPDTIRAFEEFIGLILSAEDGRCTPEAAKVCTEVTVSAAQTCDEFIVTTSALWRFLFDPAEASGTSWTDPRGVPWSLSAAGAIHT